MRRPEPSTLCYAFLLNLALAGCLALACCLSLASCYGTSTDTENTLTGTAYLSDGRPAAGATLAIRSGKLVVSPQGVPAWKTLATATADSKGRFFDVTLPQGTEIYLEVRQSPADTAGQAHSPEVYFISYDIGDERPTEPGGITLSPSGSLKGSLGLKTGPHPENQWLGVVGTSVFVKLDSATDSTNFPFQLDGLYPGTHALSVVTFADVGGGDVTVMGTTTKPTGVVAPDSVTDLGLVPYTEASIAEQGKN